MAKWHPTTSSVNSALFDSTTVATGVGENKNTHGSRTIDQKIKVVAAPERQHSACLTSTLSSAGKFHQMWIPKAKRRLRRHYVPGRPKD